MAKAVWNFSENSSVLEGEGVPKKDPNCATKVVDWENRPRLTLFAKNQKGH